MNKDENTNEQTIEQATQKIQHYSKFVPATNIETPEQLTNWLNDDNWE